MESQPTFLLPDFLRHQMMAELLRLVVDTRGPDQTILTRDGRPYLRRWHVTPRGEGPATYLHHFLASDDDRALHDHPWPSIGTILRGSYLEHLPGAAPVLRQEGEMIFRAPEHIHRVELLPNGDGREQDAWTLFQVGPRVRPWGFHCADGWKHWQAFTAAGADGQSVGCE